MAPYIHNGKIVLTNQEAIFLYEFNPDLASSAADYQDLVALIRFFARCSFSSS